MAHADLGEHATETQVPTELETEVPCGTTGTTNVPSAPHRGIVAQDAPSEGGSGAVRRGAEGAGGCEASASNLQAAVCVLTDESILEQVRLRQEARQQREFARADSIRDALLQRGILLQDKGKRTFFKRLQPTHTHTGQQDEPEAVPTPQTSAGSRVATAAVTVPSGLACAAVARAPGWPARS